MLDAIEERMKQGNETMAATQKMLGERGFKISTHMVERARKTVATNKRTPILALYHFP